MKKYKKPTFESVYFELDKKLMDTPIPTDGGDIEPNPWADDFESGSKSFNGLTFRV